MNKHEWTWKFAERLHKQWPRVDRVDVKNAAESLHHEERWRSMELQQAAQEWLRQGMPTEGNEAESTSSP